MHVAHHVLFALGLTWFAVGCADPKAVGHEAALAYFAPLEGLNESDCVGSLERGRAAQDKARSGHESLRKRIDGARGTAEFDEGFTTVELKLLDGARHFPASCLREAHELNAMLQDNATALGRKATPWFDAKPSEGRHKCMRRGICEEYIGPGQTQSLRQFVCTKAGGEWARGSCPRGDAVGVCRHDAGAKTESALIRYGSAPRGAHEAQCTTPDKGRSAGLWEPIVPSSPAGSAAPAASPAPAARPPAAPPRPTPAGGAPRAPAPPAPGGDAF